MLTSYDLGIFGSCMSCAFRTENSFCRLTSPALNAFEWIKMTYAYAKDKVLFLEGEVANGIFVLCKGKVKLSLCAGDGKTFILNVAQPGEALGLSAAISGRPYEFTATSFECCQVSFVKRSDFLRFLKDNPGACFRITLCWDCGTSLCSQHAELCELCSKTFCQSCLDFHQNEHTKPAQSDQATDSPRRKTA